MIAILGEALIDLIGSKKEGEENCFYYYVGGCAHNAAIALARLENEVFYVGKLSGDLFGQQLKRSFTENGVLLLDNLCNVRENSTVGFATLDKNGSASYNFYTEGTTITNFSAQEILSSLKAIDELHYLHVGSVALAVEQSGVEIVKALRALATPPFIFFDPNVRPTVITDWDSYRKRVVEVASMSSMIKLSDEDLELLFPALDEQEALLHLLELGAQHIVLTKGAKGIQWRSQDNFDVSIPAVKSSIIDTVGAGDTVSGALLSFLEEEAIGPTDFISEEDALRALKWAASAAAITIGREGANPPYRSEIEIE